jgi:hypothetical protein
MSSSIPRTCDRQGSGDTQEIPLDTAPEIDLQMRVVLYQVNSPA